VHARDDGSAARAVDAVLAAYDLAEGAAPEPGILLEIVA
jgi:hypothetical protein